MNWHTFRWASVATALCALAALGGCGPSRQAAVPDNLADKAMVLNDPSARTWSDVIEPVFAAELQRAALLELEERKKAGLTGPLPPANYLAISGGGQNGAYGAGLLCAWTAMGTRPEFKAVTGISTGALTAPFAFLGPRYDSVLKEVYTTVCTSDICTNNGFLGALFGESLLNNSPLRKLLDKYVTDQVIKDIATEYARGRLLLIGTTNLDEGRGVIWNIGNIATKGTPEAYELIRRILVASAAIPAAFPPMMIDVTADGKPYQEMHVDGGACAQVFLYPPSMDLKKDAAAMGITRDRVAWVIRNSRLDPHWQEVERRTLSIAARAVDCLIQTQGVGDLYQIFLITRRDGVKFNLAFIPESFKEQPNQDFDPPYMTKLFNTGERDLKENKAWHNLPPSFTLDPNWKPGS